MEQRHAALTKFMEVFAAWLRTPTAVLHVRIFFLCHIHNIYHAFKYNIFIILNIAGEYASHCCPRWTVCCTGGGRYHYFSYFSIWVSWFAYVQINHHWQVCKYGCCDPATQKPMDSNYGYALFVLEKYFGALKIDLSTGAYTQVAVNGYFIYFILLIIY